MTRRRRRLFNQEYIPQEHLRVNITDKMRSERNESPEQFENSGIDLTKATSPPPAISNMPTRARRDVRLMRGWDRVEDFEMEPQDIYSQCSGTISYDSIITAQNMSTKQAQNAELEESPQILRAGYRELITGSTPLVAVIHDADLYDQMCAEKAPAEDAQRFRSVYYGETEQQYLDANLHDALQMFYRLPRDDVQMNVTFTKQGAIPSMEMSFVRIMQKEEKIPTYSQYVYEKTQVDDAPEDDADQLLGQSVSQTALTTARDVRSSTSSSSLSTVSTVSRLSRITTSTTKSIKGTFGAMFGYLKRVTGFEKTARK